MFEYLAYAHTALSLMATFVIFKLDYSERSHAFSQCVIAWAVPFFGPVGILVFQSVVHSNMTTKAQPDKPNLNNDVYGSETLFLEPSSDDGD